MCDRSCDTVPCVMESVADCEASADGDRDALTVMVRESLVWLVVAD